MEFRLSTHLALLNLWNAKLRSLLAVLGILVGTGAVVALMSLGQLATGKALEQFEALGTDLLSVTLIEAQTPEKKGSAGNQLTLKEVNELRDSLDEIEDIAPYMTLFQSITYHGTVIRSGIVAAEDSLARIVKIDMESGNFVSFLDEYEHYCVIGRFVADELEAISKTSPVGQQIWLGDTIYTIIGIMKPVPENPFFNQDLNKSVVVPIRGAALLNANAQINNLIIRLSPNANIERTTELVTSVLEKYAPNKQFFTRSAKEVIKRMENQGQIFTLLLGLIGSISLLVGGIGVMNVMLVSVTERRREIGIRMAIGAKRRDIRSLFLIESVVLSLVGGTLGVIVGVLAVMIIGLALGWGFHLYLFPPLVGFIVSSATGVFFGFYPAHRASQLDPIETLRHE